MSSTTKSKVRLDGLGRPATAAQPGTEMPGSSGHQLLPPSVLLNTPRPMKPAYSVLPSVGSITRLDGLALLLPATLSLDQLRPPAGERKIPFPFAGAGAVTVDSEAEAVSPLDSVTKIRLAGSSTMLLIEPLRKIGAPLSVQEKLEISPPLVWPISRPAPR